MKTMYCCLLLFMGLAYADPPASSEAPLSDTVLSRTLDATTPGITYHAGQLFWNDALFTGWLVRMYDNGQTKQRTAYSEGRRHGQDQGWYPDGNRMFERHYNRGRKEGLHQGWWENGQEQYRYTFEADVYEGNAKAWYEDGSLFKDFNYEAGKESGTQRMWWEDGTLRANYVIREGRRFGLMGAKPCTNL